MTFQNLEVDPRCLSLLEKQDIVTPTPVQEQAIPPALDGQDVTAIAQTGTGKTLAFGLAALTRLAGTPRGKTAMLVLAPTRELAVQVHGVLSAHAKALKLSTACIYGGVGMKPQADALRRGATIVVATPGRLLDHIGRGNARLNNVSILVLDEADRMLDMGFLPDIRRILDVLPKERQTMMFSATFPREIARLSETMQRDPVRVEVGGTAKPVDAVRQSVYAVEHAHKPVLLARLLKDNDLGTTLIFVRTKRAADRVAETLSRMKFQSEAIHGGHTQGRRQNTLDGFRKGRIKILVATDVAARGLDVKGIAHVINYDIPGTPDDYVHRIGRTARADAEGDAITFVSPGEERDLGNIERVIGRPIDRTNWEREPMLASTPSKKNHKIFGPPSRGRRRGSASKARRL